MPNETTRRACIAKQILRILAFAKGLPPAGRQSKINQTKGVFDMKATGIVRRIDDLGRVVIPKEIRRTMRIREGDPSQTTWTWWEMFCFGMLDLAKRTGLDCTS